MIRSVEDLTLAQDLVEPVWICDSYSESILPFWKSYHLSKEFIILAKGTTEAFKEGRCL